MDKQSPSIQKQLIRLLYHTHYNNFEGPGIVGSLDSNKTDIYLSHPQIDFLNKTLPNKEIQNTNVLNPNNPDFQQNTSLQHPGSGNLISQNIHNQQSVRI